MEPAAQQDPRHQRVPLGGDYWQVEPAVPLWGFADLHAHLMAHLAYGGGGFWGQPYDPEHPGPEGMRYALANCEPMHGGLINANPEFGHPPGGGWPNFEIWPRFTTLVHQQAYIDWLYRAYQGGLRLVSCAAVNNELLGSKTAADKWDDKSAIEAQVVGMKEMVAFVDRQSGGPGRGWLQIVYSAAEARRIIGEDKLAVILAVEVDSLGNWRRYEDLAELCEHDPAQARRLIRAELDWLYDLGVRQITPIHLTDNPFGGAAIYMRLLGALNRFVTGRQYEVEDAWDTGIRYRVDADGAGEVFDEVERLALLEGRRLSPPAAVHDRSLLQHLPGARDLVDALDAPEAVAGGHANIRGLTDYGIILVQEIMDLGIILDVEHMSQKTLDQALTLAESASYPVVCSHTVFRDLAFTSDEHFDPDNPESYGTSDARKLPTELGLRTDQVERIGRLGGVVAPILNPGDIVGLRRALPHLAAKVVEPCSASSTSWAQEYLYAVAKMGGRGVAMGSDLNGAAGLPGPRFGTFAAYGTHGDHHRTRQRRGEIDRQTAGVRYGEPISDYRWFRFEDSGPGAYDDDEREIWEGIAEFKAGFNPWQEEHGDEDSPPVHLTTLLESVFRYREQRRVDNIAKGLWAAANPFWLPGDEPDRWPHEMRAAYLLGSAEVPGPTEDDRVLELLSRMNAIWAKWEAMEGPNPPLLRSKAGPKHDFDINIDGVAHYGMLPDLLQDLRNIGLSHEDLVPLFRSANDCVEMWEKCQGRSL